MALTTILQKEVWYKDGLSAGNVTVDGLNLPVRYRYYPVQRVLTLDSFFALSLTPARSNWAAHPREFWVEKGQVAADVQYLSTRANFAAIALAPWSDDERHLEGNADPQNTKVLGDTPNPTLEFRIKTDGTIETRTAVPNDTIQLQQEVNKKAQETAIVTKQAEDVNAKNAKMSKYIKIVLLGLLGVGVAVGGYFLFKNYQKNSSMKKMAEMRSKREEKLKGKE